MIKKIKELYGELPFEARAVFSAFIILTSIFFTLEALSFFTILFRIYFGSSSATFVLLVVISVLLFVKKR